MKGFPAFFCLLFLKSVYAFSQDTPIITYDCQNPGTLAGVLPFDQPFRFHFINIDSPAVNSITVRFYKVGITDYHRLLRNKKREMADSGINQNNSNNIVLTNDDIIHLPENYILKPDSIVRGIDFSGKEAYMKSFLTLQPNSGYFIQISQHLTKEITPVEKEEVFRAIKADPNIRSLIDSFSRGQIENTAASFDGINKRIALELQQRARTVIKSVDESYVLPEINLSKLKASLANGFLSLNQPADDLKNSINSFAQAQDAAPNFTRDSARLSVMKDSIVAKLKRVDWMNANSADPDIAAIKSDIADFYGAIIASGGYPDAATDSAAFPGSIDDAITTIQETAWDIIEKQVSDQVRTSFLLNNTFPKEYLKQAQQFISSYLGFAYIWGIDRLNPYAAIHISASPLNDSIPLNQFHGFSNFLRSRLSLLIGISVDAISKDSVRHGIFGGQALVVGAGFRLLTWLRLSSGYYIYYKEFSNPLVPRNRFRTYGSPFISLSIDIRVQSLLKGIGTAIFKVPPSP